MLLKHFSLQKKESAEKIYSVGKNLFLLIIIFFGGITNAQNVPFPFGVYIGVGEKGHFELDSNYQQIKDMGANGVIQYLAHPDSNEISRSEILNKFDNVIALNARNILDLPVFYTTGFYNKWYAKNIITEGIGLKKEYGSSATVNGVECLSTGGNSSNAGNLWIIGPDYFQEVRYPSIDETLTNDTLKYNLRLHVIKGSLIPEEEFGIENVSDTLLKIEVTANYLHNSNEYSFLLKTFYVTDGQLSTSFPEQPINLGFYDYSTFLTAFDSVVLPFRHTNGVSQWFRPEETPANAVFLRGVQYKIYWMGKRIVYLDYLDLYDDFIWKEYIDAPGDFANRLIAYDNTYKAGTNGKLKYWYSRDEPYYLDSFEPYRVVDEILNNNTRLITGITTGYDGNMEHHWNYEHGLERITSRITPHRFMTSYYPYGIDNELRFEFLNLHLRLYELQEYTKNKNMESFYSLIQTFGDEIKYRRPNGKEVKASVFMALALGVKGIYFW